MSRSDKDTFDLGERVGKWCRGGEVFALHAPLGAGKTVFAKGMARGLGISENVTSPTYTIVSEYRGTLGLIHVDLYRIDTDDEYEQLAVHELMDERTVTVIEWPERAGDALPAHTLMIEIAIRPGGERVIILPDGMTPARERDARP